MKGNVVEFFIVFKKDVKPYEPKPFIPVDLNENSVSVLVHGKPMLLETNTKRRAIQGSFANCNISVDLDLFNEEIIEYI